MYDKKVGLITSLFLWATSFVFYTFLLSKQFIQVLKIASNLSWFIRELFMLTFSDMVKTNKNTEERELRRKEKKDAERRRREHIKNDPQLYEGAKRKERERYHERKQQGKVKLVSEMPARLQKAKRKSWKVAAKNTVSIRRKKIL